MSIDLYVGGMEHAVGHLIYARFITKALRDMGYVAIDEPFTAVRNQGLILGENGEKMSKSKGNVVNPDDIVIAVGADALRMYEMFMGPLDESKPWNTNGAMGVFRFLQKVWRLQEKVSSTHKDTKQLQRELHKAIYKITHDIEALRFNTAISAMMIYINMCEKEEALSKEMFETFILLLSPFAPFIAEELWERMGHDNTIAHEPWPTYDPTLLQEDEVTIGVQFNGKTRGQLTFQKGLVEKEVMALIAQDNGLEKYYQGEPAKVIFVPDKIINIIY
jgi:leucyl-tRNA synthetase